MNKLTHLRCDIYSQNVNTYVYINIIEAQVFATKKTQESNIMFSIQSAIYLLSFDESAICVNWD